MKKNTTHALCSPLNDGFIYTFATATDFVTVCKYGDKGSLVNCEILTTTKARRMYKALMQLKGYTKCEVAMEGNHAYKLFWSHDENCWMY